MTNSIEFLNKVVNVKIDRPLGSKHPKHDIIYPINYGYVPNTISFDGEELDAYVLGINEPIETFTGKCIAVIHRINDNDDKLIVVPENQNFTNNEIRNITNFQEKFFTSEILRLPSGLIIRPAIYEDCQELSKLKREIWETTYRGIYPNEKIDNYDYMENELKFKNFINNPCQQLYVVSDKTQIVAYIEFGKPFRPFKDYSQEIGLFYIKKDYQRHGIGKVLFNLVLNYIKTTNVNEFFISCHKYNINARKFYEKMGGKLVQVDEDTCNNGIPQVKYEYNVI